MSQLDLSINTRRAKVTQMDTPPSLRYVGFLKLTLTQQVVQKQHQGNTSVTNWWNSPKHSLHEVILLGYWKSAFYWLINCSLLASVLPSCMTPAAVRTAEGAEVSFCLGSLTATQQQNTSEPKSNIESNVSGSGNVPGMLSSVWR